MFVWSKRLVATLLGLFVLMLGVFLFNADPDSTSGLKIHTTRWMALNYLGLVAWVFVWMIDQARMRGKDTSAGVREKGMRRRADVDPGGPRFPGQDEVAGEGGTGLELDHVSRLGGMEGGLEIAAGLHGDELAARGRSVRGVEEDPGQFGFGLGEGSGGQQGGRGDPREDKSHPGATGGRAGSRKHGGLKHRPGFGRRPDVTPGWLTRPPDFA